MEILPLCGGVKERTLVLNCTTLFLGSVFDLNLIKPSSITSPCLCASVRFSLMVCGCTWNKPQAGRIKPSESCWEEKEKTHRYPHSSKETSVHTHSTTGLTLAKCCLFFFSELRAFPTSNIQWKKKHLKFCLLDKTVIASVPQRGIAHHQKANMIIFHSYV